MMVDRADSILARHWFVLFTSAVVGVDVLVARAGPITPAVEAGLLLDLVVLLPALCVLSAYGKGKGGLVRGLGLACLGIWIAAKLIPEPDRGLLEYIAPLRYGGLAVLVLLELAVVRLIFVALRSGGSKAEAAYRVSSKTEMPPWVARLVAWEIGIWRKVISWGKGLLGRSRDDA
jgi:hypothetical protein